MSKEPRTPCRTPAEGREGVTNIPTWKFDLLRAAILKCVGEAGEGGMAYKDLTGAVGKQISAEDLAQMGKLGWHVISVKLEMEVRGELRRVAGKSPQQIILTYPI